MEEIESDDWNLPMEGEQQSIPSWCRAAFALEAEYDALNEREWDAAARVWCPKQCSPWLLRAAERAGISRQPSAPAAETTGPSWQQAHLGASSQCCYGRVLGSRSSTQTLPS